MLDSVQPLHNRAPGKYIYILRLIDVAIDVAEMLRAVMVGTYA